MRNFPVSSFLVVSFYLLVGDGYFICLPYMLHRAALQMSMQEDVKDTSGQTDANQVLQDHTFVSSILASVRKRTCYIFICSAITAFCTLVDCKFLLVAPRC